MGALPLRTGEDGELEVLLVTSRETGRWVIPKGWPSKRMDDPSAAAREALQEAGVTGDIATKPLGSYRYLKRDASGARLIDVTVFRLDVKKEKRRWHEMHERVRAWFSPVDAARRVREPQLRQLIAAIGGKRAA